MALVQCQEFIGGGGATFHQKINAGVADSSEAEALVQWERGIVLFDVNRHWPALFGGLVQQVQHDRAADSAAAVLQQQGNVNDSHLIVAPLYIEPAECSGR